MMAADAAETSSKFDAVFKGSAESVRAWAHQFAAAFGQSRYAMEGMLSQFQDTFVPMGFARTQAAELSQTMTRLALDMASYHNIAADEAVNSMTSALVGNHEALRKFGVIITQTRLDAQLLAMGFNKVSQGATEQQKVLARLSLILADTGDAHGDLARTSDSAANQIKAIANQIKDLGADIGTQLMPMALWLMQWIKAIAEAIGKWIKVNQGAIASIVKWSAAIVAVIIVLPTLIGMIASMISMVTALKAAVGGPAGLAITLTAVTVALGATAFIAERVSSSVDGMARSMNDATAEAKRLRAGMLKENEFTVPDFGGGTKSQGSQNPEKLRAEAGRLRAEAEAIKSRNIEWRETTPESMLADPAPLLKRADELDAAADKAEKAAEAAAAAARGGQLAGITFKGVVETVADGLWRVGVEMHGAGIRLQDWVNDLPKMPQFEIERQSRTMESRFLGTAPGMDPVGRKIDNQTQALVAKFNQLIEFMRDKFGIGVGRL